MRVQIGAAALLLIIAVPISGSVRRAAQRDRDGLEAIERQWLASEHDRAALGRILAEDFLHPVPAGVFLTKAQHIDWAVRHPAPSGRQQRFDQLRIRRYGDVGLVTGLVISTDGVAGRIEPCLQMSSCVVTGGGRPSMPRRTRSNRCPVDRGGRKCLRQDVPPWLP